MCNMVIATLINYTIDDSRGAYARPKRWEGTKAATDPKNWIRDSVGSDPDPDPLTNGAIFH